MAWYTEWFNTRYYQLLYGHRDNDDARGWVEMIMARAGLMPGMELLDMGCGRGRHAQLFAEAGLKVVGIDLSESSVADARERASSVEFHVHDMRNPFATARFDGVVCLFTSLGYSNNRADDQSAVDAAALALKPGAIFVLDLFNGSTVRQELVKEECRIGLGVRFTIQRAVEEDTIVKRILVDDGGLQQTYVERVHAWTVEEVTTMVERAGLRIEAITNGPDPVPFDPHSSERIVVWARKPR